MAEIFLYSPWLLVDSWSALSCDMGILSEGRERDLNLLAAAIGMDEEEFLRGGRLTRIAPANLAWCDWGGLKFFGSRVDNDV
jgi:hypothetical protein